jgi:hypothetical protein
VVVPLAGVIEFDILFLLVYPCLWGIYNVITPIQASSIFLKKIKILPDIVLGLV